MAIRNDAHKRVDIYAAQEILLSLAREWSPKMGSDPRTIYDIDDREPRD